MSGGILRLAGYGIGLLATLASTAIVVRTLGVVDTGRLYTAIALIGMAAGLSDLGLAGIGVREFSVLGPTERRAFMTQLLGLRLVAISIGAMLAVTFSILAGYGASTTLATIGAAGGLALQTVQSHFAVPLNAALRFRWVAALTFLMQIGRGAAMAIAAVLGGSFVLVAWAPVAGVVVAVGITVWLARGEVPFVAAWRPAQWRSLVASVAAYALAVALAAMYFRLATIMTSLLSTAVETGYFTTAFRVTEGLSSVPALLASTAFPVLARAARSDHERLRAASARLTEVMLAFGLFCSLGIGLGAAPLVDVLAGSRYGASVPVLRLLAPSVVGLCLSAGMGYTLLSLRRHRAILLGTLSSTVTILIASALLIGPFGARGAAGALTLAELTLAVAYAIGLQGAGVSFWPAGNRVARLLGAALIGTLGGVAMLGVIPLVAMCVGPALFVFTAFALGVRIDLSRPSGDLA